MGRKPRIPAALESLLGQEGRHLWSLEELHAGLTGLGVAADFSSVFRAAAKLEAEGLLRRVDLGDGRSHFEAAGRLGRGGEVVHHDHIRCEICGFVTAVPCGLVESAVRSIERGTGFAVSGHSLVLTGVCPSCAPRDAVARAGAPEAGASGVALAGAGARVVGARVARDARQRVQHGRSTTVGPSPLGASRARGGEADRATAARRRAK